MTHIFLDVGAPHCLWGQSSRTRVKIMNLTWNQRTLRCAVRHLHGDIQWAVGCVHLDLRCESSGLEIHLGGGSME